MTTSQHHNRPSTADQRRRLKTRSARIVKTLEGVVDASLVTRISKTSVANACDHRQDYFLPIDAVLDMEMEAGAPVITEALALMQGYRLTPIDAGGEGIDLLRTCAEAAHHLGAFSDSAVSAMEDGRITTNERAQLMETIKAGLAHYQKAYDSLAVETEGVVRIRKEGTV